METESKQQILERRKEIEQKLLEMLKETESDFNLDHVREAIFNEEDNDDMMKVVAMFDQGGNAIEFSAVLELVTDAWNYFPHKVLGGISPADLPACLPDRQAEASAQAGKLLERQSPAPWHECPECHLKYREKEWAEKCEAWCRDNHSCSLEITAHAEK